jgi:RAC serine/threonine-protein kinase
MSTITPKTGWIVKEGGSNKTWHKRFVVLDARALSYYTKEDKKKLKGEVLIKDVQGTNFVGDFGKHKNVFEIITPERVYHMKAPNADDSRSWSEFIKSIIEKKVENNRNPTNSTSVPLTNSSSTATATQNNNHANSVSEKKVTVDDFRKVKVVGKGAFGKVFLVKKKDTSQVFAMKVLNKKDIKERDEIEHTLAEKSVLSKVKHPFLANLHFSFQSETSLYFIMDFINGGEVFHHLSNEGCFSEERSKFYTAEILLGLEYLHKNGVVYRDLKPENLLLNYQGHVVITDFGLSKEGLVSNEATTKTFCGTPEYLAPEIIKGEKYTKAVDWWSLGTLLYEMMNGLPPYYVDGNEELMYEKILYAPLQMPDTFSDEVKDFISKLLERNPEQRLQDPAIMKQHPFFSSINWDKLYAKEIQPLFVPDVQSPEDVSNIDQEFLDESVGSDEEPLPKPKRRGKPQEQSDFMGFTYQKN